MWELVAEILPHHLPTLPQKKPLGVSQRLIILGWLHIQASANAARQIRSTPCEYFVKRGYYFTCRCSWELRASYAFT